MRHGFPAQISVVSMSARDAFPIPFLLIIYDHAVRTHSFNFQILIMVLYYNMAMISSVWFSATTASSLSGDRLLCSNFADTQFGVA